MDDTWHMHSHLISGGKYTESVVSLGRMSTFRELFALWQHAPSVIDVLGQNSYCLLQGSSVCGYSVFRDGINPAWEDPANENGGTLYLRERMSPSVLNDRWLAMWVAMCNEEFEGATGVRVVGKWDRRFGLTHKLELWLHTQKEQDVKRTILQLADAVPDASFCWAPHGRGATHCAPSKAKQ